MKQGGTPKPAVSTELPQWCLNRSTTIPLGRCHGFHPTNRTFWMPDEFVFAHSWEKPVIGCVWAAPFEFSSTLATVTVQACSVMGGAGDMSVIGRRPKTWLGNISRQVCSRFDSCFTTLSFSRTLWHWVFVACCKKNNTSLYSLSQSDNESSSYQQANNHLPSSSQ